jgi:predicted transcriptional regulator
MQKTTVYLTSEQKQALAQAAQAEGRSEARLIREGIESITARHRVAAPTVQLVDSGRSDLAERSDEVARRPRWMTREEFVSRFVRQPADSGLRAELREMTPDTTDDVALR